MTPTKSVELLTNTAAEKRAFGYDEPIFVGACCSLVWTTVAVLELDSPFVEHAGTRIALHDCLR